MKRYVKLFLGLVLAISLGVLLYRAYDGLKSARVNEEALQIAGLSGVPEQSEPLPEEPELLPEEALPEEAAHLARSNLAALRAVNEDVVG